MMQASLHVKSCLVFQVDYSVSINVFFNTAAISWATSLSESSRTWHSWRTLKIILWKTRRGRKGCLFSSSFNAQLWTFTHPQKDWSQQSFSVTFKSGQGPWWATGLCSLCCAGLAWAGGNVPLLKGFSRYQWMNATKVNNTGWKERQNLPCMWF